jgi:hypothetical protein
VNPGPVGARAVTLSTAGEITRTGGTTADVLGETMKLHRTHDAREERPEAALPTYRARHLRDVPVDAAPETESTGGSHALRQKTSVIRRLVRTDTASA